MFSVLALIIVGVALLAPLISPHDPYDAVMSDPLKAPDVHVYVRDR